MATSFSTAYLTPKERIVAARDTISSNNAARIERAMQIRQLKLDTQAKEVALEQEAASVPKYSTGERIGHTLGDFLGNIAGGVVGFVEGITDFGATVVGGIGSLFDKDFGEDVKQWTERSWTQEEVVNPILEATPGSYINDASETVQNITRGVASGVGQILPAVVISVATAGAGAPAAVANIASLASVGVSAAGRGAEAAFQEGADYGGAIGYGVLSGAVEVAIEKLSGGMGKAFFGKGITDDIVTNVVRKATSNRTAQKGLQILMEAGGEAAEEWASELLNPYLKRMTYDSEAELSTSKERLEAALIGGLSSLAFRGTVGQIGQHSRYAAEEVKNISDADTKEYRLWLDDKLTEGKASEISAFRDSARQNLSSELSKMGSKRRAAFIQQYNLQDMINEDGSLKAQAANESNATVNDALASIAVADRGKISGNIAAEDSSVSAQTVQGAYNKSAYTPSLYGKEDTLRYQPTTQTLSSEEVEAKRLFGKFNRGKKRVDLVFVDDMGDVEGNMVNGALYNNVLYINRASGSPIRQLLVHEMTHYARGTREYYKLRDFLLNNVSTENFESIKRKIADAYGIDYNTLVEKNKRYATMSEEEKRAFNSEYSEFDDELVAHIAEDLFSNEESINSIAISSKSFARRIWNWIKDKIKSFGGGKTKAEREAVSILRQAEKLYARALESAVGRRTRGVDSEGEIDSNAEILYNRKTRYIQWKSDALAWANTHSTRIGDMRSGADARFTYFYEAYDPNGDGRATDYRVIAKVSHINQRLINDWYAEVKENNERNHASLYESIDEYGLIRGEHQSDNRTLLEEASTNGRVGGVHQGESEGDGKRTSQKGDGNRKIRYSLSSKQGEQYRFLSKLGKVEAQYIESQDKWHVYCENRNGYLEYDGILDEEGLESRFGEEFGADIYTKADPYYVFDKSWIDYYADEIKPEERYDGDYLAEAKETYGTTDNPALAGYINTDGTMLDFSGGYESRFIDHSEIDVVFDEESGADAMYAYMRMGNIRLMPEAPSLEFNINAEPTSQQYSTIGKAIDTLIDKHGEFFIEFSNDEGHSIADRQYGRGVSTNKIVSDIQYFFRNGRLPQQSEFSEFRYSLSYVEPSDAIRYSRPDKETLNALNTGATIKVYRAMQIIDGQLYPPMAARVRNESGEKQLVMASELGQWEQADERPELMRKGNKFTLDKANGSSIEAAYNPYFHTSRSPLNDQFSSAYKRGNLVIVEGAVPASELTSGYRAQHAKDAVGEMKWHSGPVSSKLPQGKERKVILSRWFKPVRIVPDAEVASLIAEMLDGENISIPQNVVTPSLLNELIKQGVAIERKSIRFSLSSDSIKNKKFTREEVRKAFSEIGDLICADENYVIRLQRGKRGETLSFLYNEFNNIDSKNRDAQARKIADFIIARSVAEDIYASDMQGFDIVVYEAVSRYFHQIDLSSQTMRDEINHRFGGAKQARHVYALWSAPKAVRGEGADTIYESIANEIGGLPEVYNEYDAFFAIVDLYERARDSLRQTTEKALNQIMSASELSALREEIADRVLTTYRKYGSETKVHALFRQYAERIDELTRLYKESKTYNQQTNRALDAVRKIAELDGKEFKPASQLNDDRFSALIKKLKKIKWRNELVRPQTRDIIIEYGDTFYNAENPLLEFDYDGAVAQAIDLFRERRRYLQAHKGDNRVILTLDELKALNIVLQNARHMFENYDSFVRNGKRERVTEYATRGVELIDKFAPAQKGDGLLRRIARMGGNFIRQVVDPYTVMRQGDNFYTDGNGNARGVFTELYDDIRASETTAKAKVIELLREQSEFFKKTKGYRKRFNSAHVTIAGKEIPLSVGLSLSLLAKQDSVWNYEDSAGQRVATGLAEDGFGYRNRKGEFVTVGKISKKDVSDMESQFTTEDAEYLKLVRKFFKEGTSPILREAELAMKGYTTVTNEHYFPTRRYEGGIARDTLESPYQSFVGAVRPGFLEARRPRAKGIFDVGNIWKIVNEHAVMSSIYAYMAMPLDAFARVYNKNVAAEGAPVRSMKTAVTERVWSGFNKYVTELLGDITGKNSTRGFGDKLISTLMSNYAKFQLGANPKTVVGQISSYPMAAVRLDVKALMYGIRKVDFKQLDMYCPYAKVRDYEGAIVLAQSMSESIGKVGDVLTKPIQKMDRLTCGLIFNACKYQVQKEQGLKIGTEENLQAAGRLAETVIRDTQSNSVITEKSGLMRSKNGFIRLFTIFSSDAMKQVSRFIQSVGELQAIRRRQRAGEKGVEAQEKKLSKKLGKAVSSILIAQLVFTLVGQAFKSLYDREREDKEGNEISFWEDLARDYLSQIVGLLPVARDMFSFFVEGYEVNAFVYGTINDVLGAVDDTVAVFEKLVSGQATDTPDFMLPLRKSMYAIGQLMGIPVRNIYNVVYGLTKRFAPGSAYKINSLFYDGTLNADLQKAVEEGDNDLAQSIVEVIMNKQGMSDNDAINKKLVELYQAGYNALPRKLGNTVTYDGEEMSLTSRQYARFKEVYSAAEEDVMSLLNDTMFNSLDAAIQAKAIKFVYDYYWYLAIEDLLGEGLNEKKLLYAAAVPIEKLAYIVSYCQSVEEDGRYSRKEIITRFVSRQSGLSSYQKHIIMSYMGYKSTTSEYAIKAYINRLDLTRSQKDAFLGYCGISS